MRFINFWKTIAILLVLVLNAGCSRETGRVPEPDSPRQAELPDRVELYYFYEELCLSCDGAAEFDKIAETGLAGIRDRYPYVIHRINVFLQGNRELYQRICDSLGLDRNNLELPVLIAGGRVFSGNERIRENFREAFLTSGEDLFVNKRVYNPKEKKTGAELFTDYSIRPDHLSMVYFYRTTCEECGKVTPFIDSLPENIRVDGKALSLDVIRINTRSGNNSERIAAFFEQYQVPDEDRVVPIVFLADTYLAGYEAVAAGLIPRLETTPRLNRLEKLIPPGQ
jgi:thiol-disulfide isomerase/thioredoxin